MGVIRIMPAHFNIIKELLVLTIMGLLIIAGVAVPVVSFAALGLCAAVMLFSDTERGFCILFFLVPFATVFKFSVSSTSNLTYLQILLVAKAVCQLMKGFNKRFLILLLVFVLYVLIGSKLQFITAVKQIMIPLMIYCFFSTYKSDGKKVLYYFVFGLVLSGIVALFMDSIPNLEKYIVLDRAYELGNKVMRASGLYSDSNYYSIALLMAIAGLLSLYVAKRAGVSVLIVSIVLVAFGTTTISKSFLLVLAAVYLYFVITLYLRKRFVMAITFTVAGVILLANVLSGKIAMFDNILARLESGLEDMSSLTTNRSNIWRLYLEHIFNKNLLLMLFGHGIGAGYPGAVAAHSTVLDFLYYYGLVGSVLFGGICWVAAGKGMQRKFTVVNLFSWVILGAMAMALSCLIFFDFAFMIILAILNFRTDYTVRVPSKGISQ